MGESGESVIERLLLVRLRQIGDVVFTTPAIRGLRQHFPGAHITYIVEPAAAPVVTGNPHLNEVIVTPRGRGLTGVRNDIALIQLDPYPFISRPIQPGDYRATLRVTR